MATISTNTYVTNFNADGQADGIELMTDERGHMYPFSHVFSGQTAGNELAVTTSSVTGTPHVRITAGYIQIPFSDYAYLGWLDTDTDMQISASTTEGARYVAIVAYIYRDIQYNESVTNNPGLLRITDVAGAAGDSPAEVGDSTIAATVGEDNPFVVLAQVYLPSGATAVSASNIIDKRQKLTLKEGIALPSGTYSSGIVQAQGSSFTNPLELAVINTNAPIPSSASDHDILVCRISQ